MRYLITLPLLALAGCGIFTPLGKYDQNSQAYRQCDYEAKVATPSSLGILEAASRWSELVDMCMKTKGY